MSGIASILCAPFPSPSLNSLSCGELCRILCIPRFTLFPVLLCCPMSSNQFSHPSPRGVSSALNYFPSSHVTVWIDMSEFFSVSFH
jgi:hypothetical protein